MSIYFLLVFFRNVGVMVIEICKIIEKIVNKCLKILLRG